MCICSSDIIFYFIIESLKKCLVQILISGISAQSPLNIIFNTDQKPNKQQHQLVFYCKTLWHRCPSRITRNYALSIIKYHKLALSNTLILVRWRFGIPYSLARDTSRFQWPAALATIYTMNHSVSTFLRFIAQTF